MRHFSLQSFDFGFCQSYQNLLNATIRVVENTYKVERAQRETDQVERVIWISLEAHAVEDPESSILGWLGGLRQHGITELRLVVSGRVVHRLLLLCCRLMGVAFTRIARLDFDILFAKVRCLLVRGLLLLCFFRNHKVVDQGSLLGLLAAGRLLGRSLA